MNKKIKKKELKNKENKTIVNEDKKIKNYKIIRDDLDSKIFEREYKRLTENLKLGQNKKDNYVHLLEAIDNVAEDARITGNMYVAAKEEYDRFEEIEYKLWWSKLSNEATKELERLRKEGKFSGQISESKIENWIISNYEEEYKIMKEKKIKLKVIKDTLEVLYEQYKSRKSLLQTQGNVIEKRVVFTSNSKKE